MIIKMKKLILMIFSYIDKNSYINKNNINKTKNVYFFLFPNVNK